MKAARGMGNPYKNRTVNRGSKGLGRFDVFNLGTLAYKRTAVGAEGVFVVIAYVSSLGGIGCLVSGKG